MNVDLAECIEVKLCCGDRFLGVQSFEVMKFIGKLEQKQFVKKRLRFDGKIRTDRRSDN